MPVDRFVWVQSLGKTRAPAWPCPSCTKRIRLKPESLQYEQTAESPRKPEMVEEIIFTFTAILECSSCNAVISCCGEGGVEDIRYSDETGAIVEQVYDEQFFPKYFFPLMKLFQVPRFCPDPVKQQVYKSFEVFFCDKAAAANRIRQCVEVILAHAGISPKDEQGRLILLGDRIRSFATQDQENSERADALRWIGNFGTHPDLLTKDDVFDAYDILEVLLEDLYVRHYRSVRETVQEILALKGPRSKG